MSPFAYTPRAFDEKYCGASVALLSRDSDGAVTTATLTGELSIIG
jgi:hypothetical protein